MAEEGQTVTITCSKAGKPQPTITWSSAIGSLPNGTTVSNGALKIKNVSRKDGGIYSCKAEKYPGNSSNDSSVNDTLSSAV